MRTLLDEMEACIAQVKADALQVTLEEGGLDGSYLVLTPLEKQENPWLPGKRSDDWSTWEQLTVWVECEAIDKDCPVDTLPDDYPHQWVQAFERSETSPRWGESVSEVAAKVVTYELRRVGNKLMNDVDIYRHALSPETLFETTMDALFGGIAEYAREQGLKPVRRWRMRAEMRVSYLGVVWPQEFVREGPIPGRLLDRARQLSVGS